MRILNKIGKCVEGLATAFSAISFVSVIGMVVLTTADVALRSFFNRPIIGSLEIVQHMMMSFVFAAFAFTQVKKGNVRVTILIKRFNWRVRQAVSALTELACTFGILFFARAAYLSMEHTITRGVTTDVLHFTVVPFYVLAFICLIVFAIVSLFDAIRTIAAIFVRGLSDEIDKEYP